MSMTHSIEVRKRVLAARQQGLSYREISKRLGIDHATVGRYIVRWSQTASLAPTRRAPYLLGDAQQAVLKELAEADPAAPLHDIVEQLEARCGIHIHVSTASHALRKLGFKRVKAPLRRPAPTRAIASRPYVTETLAHATDTAWRKAYPTDLTDAEWAVLEPLVPTSMPGGRPEEHPRRELVNAMFYVLRNGCTWRSLPHDLPPWSTVYSYFRKWRISGLWQQINDILRPRARIKAGRAATPSAAIMDSQSARTTEKGGPMDTTATSV